MSNTELVYYTPFLKKFDGNNVSFLGDAHINHRNLVRGESLWKDKSGCRDFDTTDEMNEKIIQSCNNNLHSDSVLFLVGDFLFGDKTQLEYWLDRIKCKEKHYIYGNHCDFIRENEKYQKLFNSVQDYTEIICYNKARKKTLCCIFHYAMKVWNESHRGSYAITGHSHGSLPYTENELGLDVGWECFQKPLTFNEIDEILSKRTFKGVDHHQ